MSSAKPIELNGRRGRIVVHRWSTTAPRFVALVAHGYGEHAGRYGHVAERLIAEGATVYAPDFEGHGLSQGDRARFDTVDDLADELAVTGARGVIIDITAVEIVFVFALLGGLLVLYSALVATEDERRREAAVMRVYGASRAQVTGAQRAEFLAMGAIAGLLATLGAAAIGQLLARRVFELDLPPSLALWIAGPLAGIALLSLNAWLSSRKVLRVSPALTLRDSV